MGGQHKRHVVPVQVCTTQMDYRPEADHAFLYQTDISHDKVIDVHGVKGRILPRYSVGPQHVTLPRSQKLPQRSIS
jgi:hypothetical protein